MKKVLVLLAVLALIATGCKKKEKSKSLDYNDSNPIPMVLREHRGINVTSDYDISYSTSNDLLLEVSGSGVLYGKGVGEAQVTMSNGYESKTVDVKIDLFQEPSYEFGCSPSRIKELFGQPRESGYNDDGYLVYNYYKPGAYDPYACGQRLFYFDDNKYFRAYFLINPQVDTRLEQYLNQKFIPIDTVLGVITEDDTDSIPFYIYKSKLDETIICEKFETGNTNNEFGLIYYHYEEEDDD